MCAPGTCGSYSSTNYVILGLVLANHAGARNWDNYDQSSWIPKSPLASIPSSFHEMYYPVHGPCYNFSLARSGRSLLSTRRNATMHGFQRATYVEKGVVPDRAGLDVQTLSCLQGWTCGNLVAPTISVADFFYVLLGPPSRDPRTALLRPESIRELLSFELGTYLGNTNEFGYGLGMMNFTSMDWGFQYEGEFYGHNGLTYGFGAQSGYHVDLEFAVTWNNNAEHWIGPDFRPSGPDPVYTALVKVVREHRQSSKRENLLLV